jgi:hypothetical protein
LVLLKKEVGGLKDDNERINRMYVLVQKEAFNGVEKLKKLNPYPIDENKNQKNLKEPSS